MDKTVGNGISDSLVLDGRISVGGLIVGGALWLSTLESGEEGSVSDFHSVFDHELNCCLKRE